MLESVFAALDRDEGPSIDRLMAWLRIPSISTDPACADDCRRAAEWAADHLKESGFDVEIHETGDIDSSGRGSGRPIVFATTAASGADRSSPHVLFYGHYDVQPADPIELWRSPPFEPVLKEDAPGPRVVARGACDDKGQVMTFLEAVRAWKNATGSVAGGVNFTVLLEGEEESGSANLDRYLRTHIDLYRGCEVCLISDTGMLDRQTPAITYGVRGLAYTEVTLHGPDQDLHSGLWGGRAPNPNNELLRVLSQLWDENRRVTIPGFYSRVRDVEAAERAAWAGLHFDNEAALSEIGLSADADTGERGFSPLERAWARPTADINGIWGGYTGVGAKTVIPSRASAKVSFRLVADQDPSEIAKAFFEWCQARTPNGCRWEFHEHGGGPPATCSTNSPFLHAARRAIKRASGLETALIRSGGSIPVAGMLRTIVGLDTVFMGFGLDDDRVHSPNEKFELACYRLGKRSHAAFIDEMRTMTT